VTEGFVALFIDKRKIIRGNDLKISFLVLVFVRNNDIMRN